MLVLREQANQIVSLIQQADVKAASLVCDLLDSSPEDFDAALDEVEKHILKCIRCGVKMAEVESSWIHSNGVSIKSMYSPAGMLAIGMKHTTEHLNIIASGSMLLFSSDGPILLTAPCEFTSMKGSRKLVAVTEGMTIYNIYPNPANIRDEEVLNSMFTEDDPVLLEHKAAKEATPQEQYDMLCEIWGVVDDDMLSLMELMPQCVNEERVDEAFEKGDSSIEGIGLFATRDISAGEEFYVVKEGDRTTLARYSNHSFKPNMETLQDGTNVLVRSTRDIKKGTEITTNYMDNTNISIAAAKESREALCQQS